MTPNDQRRIQRSYVLLRPQLVPLGERFYMHLFTRAPGLRACFPPAQATAPCPLLDTLAFIVSHLDTPQRLTPTLHALGARHAAYGATRARYALVEGALLATLAEALGPAWTPDVAAAWSTLYRLVTRTMHAGEPPP